MMGARMAEAAVAPPLVIAVLGKLAISGAGAASTLTTAKTIGGLVAVKKAGIAALVALGALFAFWAVQEEPSTITREAVSSVEGTQATKRVTGARHSETSSSADRPDQSDPTDPIDLASQTLQGALAKATPARAVANTRLMGALISGVVYDSSTKKGLDGVKVTAVSAESEFSAQTDWAGRFELIALPPGKYEITSALPTGYVLSSEDEAVVVNLRDYEEQTGIEFALQLGGTMEGEIRLGDEPAMRAKFELSHNVGVGEPYVEFIETDAEGRYRITGLIPGGRTVHFRYTGAGTPNYKVPVIIEAGETTITNVQFLWGTASIEGTVYRDSRTPLVAQIEVHYLEQTFYAKSNADGYYIVEDLPAGPVQLLGFTGEPSLPDAPLQRRLYAFELNDGDQFHQDIWLAETAIACSVANIPETNFIAFFVAFNGEIDFSNVEAEMLLVWTRQRAALGAVSTDGTGTLRGLEPGMYTVVAVSFPSNPTAVEALEGQALQDFMEGLGISSAELVSIEEAGEQLSLDLSF